MRPVGYVTDGSGRRVLALVPVAQVGSAARRGSAPTGPPTAPEQAALNDLLLRPAACLETSIQANPIRAAREAAGITQADLAFAMGISQPMLSRQEQPLRNLRSATVQRALETIRRIQENRARPAIAMEVVLRGYGERLAESSARKPRDPVERRLLQEGGDLVALRESNANVREGGARRRPSRGKGP
ncbi:MAG: helix-turn-helix transcriptional regulator [Holophagaceae bacterium]